MASSIAHATLDTSLAPPKERFELFRAGIGVLHDVERLRGDARAFDARLDSWLIGGMFITSGRQGASRVLRSAARARRDGFEHVTLMHLRSGHVRGQIGEVVDCGPGDTIITDARKALDVDATDSINIGVRICRAALCDASGDDPALHGIVLRGAAGTLIANHFATLAEQARCLDPADAPLMARVTISLIRDCLRWQGVKGIEGTSQGDARARVEHFIDQAIGRQSLDIGMISRGAGLSRSSLYRMFPGGVERFIMARRLDLAHAMLRKNTAPSGVAGVGYAVGFTSASHFSSAFRRRFGVSPTDFRASELPQAGGALIDTYQRWSAAIEASPKAAA